MLDFKDEFFEDEVLEGFYVPSMIKRCWAVELEVLYEFDRICQRHNIMYFADWGTLLAAVRHGRITPWDDDMDVVMTRNEFERFYAVAQNELPKEYHFVRFENSETCWQFIINLMCNSKMCFEPEYMERHHGFPYVAGLDIFILDNYCPDENKAESWRNTIKRILSVADLMWEEKLTGIQLEKELIELEKMTGTKLKRNGSLYEKRLELYVLARNECAKFNTQETEYLSQMLPWGIYNNIFYARKDYEHAVRVPFENIEISIPIFYHKILTKKYRNYFYISKNGCTAHDYPFFEGQRKALGENIDFVPQFHFFKDMFLDRGEDRTPLIKRYSLEYRNYFKNVSAHLKSLVNSDGQFEFDKISIEELIEYQNQAITYGQYLEDVKGDKFKVIHILERYCEAVYQLSEAVSQTSVEADGNNASFVKINERAKKAIVAIGCITNELETGIEEHILNRISVIFIPYRAKYWNVFHSIWKAAAADPQCEVYVIPSPCFYKKYDGTQVNSCCEQTEYPEEVNVTSCTEFDFEQIGADVIYFQNPYDDYNMAVSVPPKFYSSNLKNNCKKLVYIPYFRENDFEQADEKQYYNMKYYCTMPGVVNADKIILASSALKQVYVQKLCDFAGEDTRTIWELKISDIGSGLYEIPTKEEAAKKLCEQGILLDTGKWMVYFTSISSLYEKKENALRKIRSVLDSFCQKREEISFIWMIDPAIEQYLAKYDSVLASEFYEIVDEYKGYGQVLWDLCQAELLADFCDAYYGDPSVIMQKFVNAAKPAMVCNYDI